MEKKQINIFKKMFIHSLSSKIVFSFNSFFHFVFLGKNKKHFIRFLSLVQTVSPNPVLCISGWNLV